MPKLKISEWDPLSNGVFRVTVNNKSYLALTRNKGVEWLSPPLLKLAKEKDGYLFYKEPIQSSVAIFASEELAAAAHPSLNSGEISRVRIEARRCAESKYEEITKFLNPPAPAHFDFAEDFPSP